MRFETFEMERLQSVWENRVKFNLSESGVHPMSTRELISDPDFLDQLLDTPLGYRKSCASPSRLCTRARTRPMSKSPMAEARRTSFRFAVYWNRAMKSSSSCRI